MFITVILGSSLYMNGIRGFDNDTGFYMAITPVIHRTCVIVYMADKINTFDYFCIIDDHI